VNVVLNTGSTIYNQLADVLNWDGGPTYISRWQESEEDVASVVEEGEDEFDDTYDGD
jgi:hypothetical protein